MVEIAALIDEVLSHVNDEKTIVKVRTHVNEVMKNYPIFAY